jgi:hypothetical protein
MNYPTAKLVEPVVGTNVGTVEINSERLSRIKPTKAFDEDNFIVLENRDNGIFEGKAYWLNDCYDWVVARDEYGVLILIPLKRK